MGGDAVTIAPDQYSVVEDNDRVRILEFRGSPGAVSKTHSHPAVVAVAVSDGKFRFTLPNGQSMDIEMKSGMAMYQDASDHAVEVLGSSDAHVILRELK